MLRIAVVLLWLLAAATAWWTAPRQQSYEQATAAVTAGRVTAYQWGDHWDDGSAQRWFGDYSLQSSGTPGPIFAWRTPDARWHWTDTGGVVVPVDATDAADDQQYAGPGAAALTRELKAAGLDDADSDVVLPTAVVAIATVLGLLLLGVLIAGPAPRLGTRWYWFWVITVVPYGLGLLVWVAREHPWSRSAAVELAPDGTPRRDRGFLGLGVGLLSALVISVAVVLLRGALGDTWLPHPG
ncbi:hypothetical protein [Krasilnikovia sp. MM14-A1259]|uniref:hypothetical protein n=1 Tax=Krasilnikovia sp. MM14-A1259 TaxID=3373539 RepID=UPI00399CCD3B